MLVVTTNDIPGWGIPRARGEVAGLAVRPRSARPQMGSGCKSMFGGALQGMARNAAGSRSQVTGRVLDEARARGAAAVAVPVAEAAAQLGHPQSGPAGASPQQRGQHGCPGSGQHRQQQEQQQ